MAPLSTNDSVDIAQRLAKLVQRTLFRGRCPQCHFADTAVRSLPYDAVGGDFYDVALTESGQSAFLIGDVSGHGQC